MENLNLKEYEEKVIELRREFHRIPEIGFKEYKTSEKIENYLKNLNLETKRVLGTGIIADLILDENKETIAFRADIDALEIDEEADVYYKSIHKGIMHACGHDAHIAMLLIAAEYFSKNKDKLKGNIRFIFQPNEEVAGAKQMIDLGVLKNPKISACFSTHIWTPVQSGKIGVASGPVMSGLEEFEVEIIGKGGHTGSPHTAIDPISAAMRFIGSLENLQTKTINPLTPLSIIIGHINAGIGRNIIAEKCRLGGTIRYLFENEERELLFLKEKIQGIGKALELEHNVKFNIKYIPSNQALINSKALLSVVLKSAFQVYGEQNIVEERSMAGEDFSEFSKQVPSFFTFIGAGNPDKHTHYPHHNAKFNIDEDMLIKGVEMHILNALNYFELKR